MDGLTADCLIRRDSMIVVMCYPAKEQKEVDCVGYRSLIETAQIDEAFQRWSGGGLVSVEGGG